MIIYEIRNKVNGKAYIGLHHKCNSNEELQNSKYWGSGILIKRAIKKYGVENFERKVLLKNIIDEKELKKYEILWIKKKKTKTSNGYNITEGGAGGDTFTNNPNKEEARRKNSLSNTGTNNGFYGKKHQEKSKIKMSKRKQGKKFPHTEVWNKNISKSLKGKHPTEEIKDKISKSLIGRFCGEESSRYGVPVLKETRLKISVANKGRSSPNKGKPLSKEIRDKISKSLEGRKASKITRLKMSKARKGKLLSVETRNNMKLGQQRRRAGEKK